MSVIFSSEELSARDCFRRPKGDVDFDAVSLGDEFDWDGFIRESDQSDLECLPLLVSELPLNSELT